jgi:hypothetical protein
MYSQMGFVLYPEYMSVYCDDDFTLWARMDAVEEDGMALNFEHRHSVHGTHKTATISRDRPEGEDTEGGGGAASMHATTARNNGYMRYVRGARLFARRSNGRGAQERHILRVSSVTRAFFQSSVDALAPACALASAASCIRWVILPLDDLGFADRV